MKSEIGKLATDLKNFIKSSDEDDLVFCSGKNNLTQVKDNKPSQAEFTGKNATDCADKAVVMEQLASQINSCARCDLGATRIKAVPGEGNINAKLMFIGEGPGYEEDRQGRPFVGKAGQLLDKIIAAMGFAREEVFIANMVKCHPMIDASDPDKRGNDRAPNFDEIAVCRRYIEQQINTILPDYVVALGGVAAKSLIMEAASLSSIRGKIYDLRLSAVELKKPVKIIATFHPAALLRNPGWKKDAWTDLKVLLAAMGRAPAPRQ
ncbi:MAG: uracil-DNA glycosylase [Elusimicrobiota bacterium]|jgi:DNA polymerase|nr:uracil-DNA glycosylase [Elusimicrobiota bacterium]